MLNRGRIIPRPARPASNANIPRPITTIPADLKNNGAFFELVNDAEPKDNNASIGSVPRANASIRNIPSVNEPVDSAATCID